MILLYGQFFLKIFSASCKLSLIIEEWNNSILDWFKLLLYYIISYLSKIDITRVPHSRENGNPEERRVRQPVFLNYLRLFLYMLFLIQSLVYWENSITRIYLLKIYIKHKMVKINFTLDSQSSWEWGSQSINYFGQ